MPVICDIICIVALIETRHSKKNPPLSTSVIILEISTGLFFSFFSWKRWHCIPTVQIRRKIKAHSIEIRTPERWCSILYSCWPHVNGPVGSQRPDSITLHDAQIHYSETTHHTLFKFDETFLGSEFVTNYLCDGRFAHRAGFLCKQMQCSAAWSGWVSFSVLSSNRIDWPMSRTCDVHLLESNKQTQPAIYGRSFIRTAS